MSATLLALSRLRKPRKESALSVKQHESLKSVLNFVWYVPVLKDQFVTVPSVAQLTF
jgi:hypothetical protein